MFWLTIPFCWKKTKPKEKNNRTLKATGPTFKCNLDFTTAKKIRLGNKPQPDSDCFRVFYPQNASRLNRAFATSGLELVNGRNWTLSFSTCRHEWLLTFRVWFIFTFLQLNSLGWFIKALLQLKLLLLICHGGIFKRKYMQVNSNYNSMFTSLCKHPSSTSVTEFFLFSLFLFSCTRISHLWNWCIRSLSSEDQRNFNQAENMPLFSFFIQPSRAIDVKTLAHNYSPHSYRRKLQERKREEKYKSGRGGKIQQARCSSRRQQH